MKKILFVIIILLFLSDYTFASEQINIKDFTNELKNYSNDLFPELSDENWLMNVIERRYEL